MWQRSEFSVGVAAVWTLSVCFLLDGNLSAQQTTATAANNERGARIAASCDQCHGKFGVSKDGIVPSLAGLSEKAIYKQLLNFRKGRRLPQWYMGEITRTLTLQDLFDVASFYARQSNGVRAISPDAVTTAADGPARKVKTLIIDGDPSRGVGACADCHGSDGGGLDAPMLVGQESLYLEIQLRLFAQGLRTTDEHRVMRGTARRLTETEIRALAAYLGSSPPCAKTSSGSDCGPTGAGRQ
jgi:cytochrome c553